MQCAQPDMSKHIWTPGSFCSSIQSLIICLAALLVLYNNSVFSQPWAQPCQCPSHINTATCCPEGATACDCVLHFFVDNLNSNCGLKTALCGLLDSLALHLRSQGMFETRHATKLRDCYNNASYLIFILLLSYNLYLVQLGSNPFQPYLILINRLLLFTIKKAFQIKVQYFPLK